MAELEEILLNEDGEYTAKDGTELDVHVIGPPYALCFKGGKYDPPIHKIIPSGANAFLVSTPTRGEVVAVQFYQVDQRYDQVWKQVRDEEERVREAKSIADAISSYKSLYNLCRNVDLSQEYSAKIILVQERDANFNLQRRTIFGNPNFRILAATDRLWHKELYIATIRSACFTPVPSMGEKILVHAVCKNLPLRSKEDGTSYKTKEEFDKHHERISIEGVRVYGPEWYEWHGKHHLETGGTGNIICDITPGKNCGHRLPYGTDYSAKGLIRPLSYHLKKHPEDSEVLKELCAL